MKRMTNERNKQTKLKCVADNMGHMGRFINCLYRLRAPGDWRQRGYIYSKYILIHKIHKNNISLYIKWEIQSSFKIFLGNVFVVI